MTHRKISSLRKCLPETRITTLPNKIIVATNDVASHIQSLGVMVAAGSRYETNESRGFSYMLAKLAYKSTSNRSVTDYALDMERHVSNLACHMGRETTLYQAHFPATSLSPVLALVSDTMLHPLLTPAEVEESILAANYELQLYDEKTDAFLMEVLQDVAFGGEALGRPNLPKPETVAVEMNEEGEVLSTGPVEGGDEGEITSEKLRAFREKWYRPERIVVAGTGMDHDTLVRLTEQQFGHLGAPPPRDPNAPIWTRPPPSASSSSSSSWIPNLVAPFLSSSSQAQSQQAKTFATLSSPVSEDPFAIGLPRTKYTGGIKIDERAEMENSHVFIGFEGVDANDEDVYALAVIQMLLGDGASFSSGGPGKGLLSRFYTGVMSGSYGIDNVNSLNLPYSDAGLFAVSLTCTPEVLNKYLNRLAYELSSLLDPYNLAYPVRPIELSRAKNRLKAAMLYAREDPRVEGEDLAAQVLTNGKRMGLGEMVGKIDKVTMDDLARVAHRVMGAGDSKAREGKGELTIVARGPVGVEKVVGMVKRAWSAKGLSVGSI
ncbi:Metalloenzyme, LuxS/M16 peptidase-like protein [Mrakia frigida]|uniref:M16 family metallopeptidase n=1 Tax=Mrakia frigida TaxID=29902 RepID=UPI003FCC06EE